MRKPLSRLEQSRELRQGRQRKKGVVLSSNHGFAYEYQHSPPFPMGTDASSKDDVCAICLEHFHGHDVAPVDADETKCLTHCGHTFHLRCLTSQYFRKPIGSRQCAMCRQNPMPVEKEKTSESLPDKFFPDETFYDACYQGDYDQVDKSLADGVNINAVMKYGVTALMLGSFSGNRAVVERQLNAGAKVNFARTEDGATPLFMAAMMGNTEKVRLLIATRQIPTPPCWMAPPHC